MSKILYAASTASHISNFHLDYIEALRKDGHEVLTMANGDGVDFNIPFEKRIFSKTNTKCRKMIRKILDEENFDVIILNTSLVAFHIRLAARAKHRPRIVNIVHGYLFSSKAEGSLKSRVKRRMLILAERITRSKTDAILTMNDEDFGIATKHRLTCGSITNTLGMGIKKSVGMVDSAPYRDELSPGGGFIMLFVGELSARKNEEYLIGLMPKIKERIPKAKLCFIGDGDERGKLESLSSALGVSDDVIFLGRRTNPREYMAAADVYVSASKSEGLPFNIVEALGEGTPVVASSVKGHVDILASGAGYLFDLDDADNFINLIENVYTGKGKPDEAAVSAAVTKYGFENVFPDTYKKIKEAAKLI